MKLRYADKTHLVFWCPGCKRAHMVRVGGDQPVWTWNGSLDSPTFTPSVLANGNAATRNPDLPRCHFFVVNGNIRFLSDSTHPLAGQTVAIPEWE